MQYLTKNKLSAIKQVFLYDKSFQCTKKYNKSIKDVKTNPNTSAIPLSPLFHQREGVVKEIERRELPARSKGSEEEISLTDEEENTRDTQHWIISRSSEVWKEGGTASLTPQHYNHLSVDNSSYHSIHENESTSVNSILKTLQIHDTCKSNKVRSTEESAISNKRQRRKFLQIFPRGKSFLKGLFLLHPSKRKSLLHVLSSTTKMDHEDLMAELPQIEKLSNQERLRLAHKRRMLQLKRFQQYDKEIGSRKHKNIVHEGKGGKGSKGLNGVTSTATTNGKGGKRIRFRNSIMLLEAAGRNDVEEVRRLLSSGVSPDVCNEDGLTALHQCCIDDNEEMMKLLLEYGANVNSEDSEKWQPLHASATCGHLHLVKYLIAKGANLLAVNAEGNMPYDICDEEATLDYIESEMAKRGVTQELIEETRALPETMMLKEMQNVLSKGTDLELRDVDGATPLHISAANGYYRVVEFLLDNHVATDVQDKDNWQPIHAAACWGHLDVLELLVQNGADLNARTRNNETPYAICEDPEIKERIIQLRNEQEFKKEAANSRRLKRTQSSNSRTQSIRRTSQRDKGLTTKRDTANEAHILMSRENSLKDNSPSPTADINGEAAHMVETSSEEEDKGALPLTALGRDSISQIKVASNEMDRLTMLAEKAQAEEPEPVSSTINNNLKSNHVKNNNVNKSNINNPNQKKFNAPKPHQITDTNANLPKPEINPSVDNKVQIGSNGISLSGSRDSLVGVGNGTIDIHVQVTINTNSPSSTLTNGETMPSLSMPSPYLTSGIMPGSTILSSPPGTLSDLKKHRSLNRTTSNPQNNGSLEAYPNSCSTSSSSSSFSGDKDRDLVVATSFHEPFHNAYTSPNHSFIPSSYEYEQGYCKWNYSQSEFDSASFAYSGGSALICNNIKPQQAFCKDDFSNYDYLYDDAGLGVGGFNMHSNTNKMNNKMYINNLTGVSNDLPSKKASYGAPSSPTMSLPRYVGEPTEIRDYDDGGKKCCVIV